VIVNGGSYTPDEYEGEQVADDQLNHHEINYIEFEVSDMRQTQQFYEAAFDWKFTDYGPDYSGIQKPGGGEVGGLRLTSEVATGGPLVILYSRDLDGSLTAVREAGGTVTQDPFEFPGGRRFHFKDPSGNELAVWSDK
jgi:predicted enzyme related to lactoylglutathione lyase